MQSSRSPPKYTKLTNVVGGSTNGTALSLTSLATTTSTSATTSSTLSLNRENVDTSPVTRKGGSNNGSTLTLNSNCSKNRLIETNSTENLIKPMYYQHSHAHSHIHHHHHSYHHHSNSNNNANSGSGSGSSSNRSISNSTGKRGRRNNWGTRERTGMSFLIVIAFFAVFGLIILTELFMIDERSHSAMVMLRHGGNYGNRLGDSMPDYDNVKEDYDLLEESILGDNKLGFVQLRGDNKLKMQDASNNDGGRLAGILLNSGSINGFGMNGGGMGIGGGGGGGGFNVPQIPWGKVLPPKIEETLPPYPIGMKPTSGSWQVVNGTRFKFFVFSAYYDRRDGAKLVRVIGATKTRGPERVWCRFWYRNSSSVANGRHSQRYTSATVMARVKIIRENWNLKYSACFILCPIRGPELEVPHFVSIVSRLRAPPGNLLTLRNTDWDTDFTNSAGNHSVGNATNAATASPPTGDQIPDKIGVCVKPFHFNYDQALYLIEYLEFYALLGVSHFTFYNHTLGPHADCVLQHYSNGNVPDTLTAFDGEMSTIAAASIKPTATNTSSVNNYNVHNQQQQQQSQTHHAATVTSTKRQTNPHYVKPTINILPWNLRMRSQKEIRTEGLFAALNDCLYRNMYRHKYLALVDLDEFIVPRHNDTLYDLISSLNHRFPNRNIGAYSFQNAFFYLQFPDDTLVYQNTPNSVDARVRAALVTQRKTKRRFKLHPQKQRSKYICKPETVVEVGNHFVWEFSPGKGSLNVAPTEAILQHYRVCEFGGNDCIKAPSVVDRTATKYVNRLVQRVESVYKHLKTRCDLPELPVLPKIMPKVNNNEENTSNQKNKPQKSSQTQNNNNNESSNKQSAVPATITNSTTNEKYKSKGGDGIITKTVVSTTLTSKTNATTTKSNETILKSGAQEVPSNKTIAKPTKPKRKLIVFEEDENGFPRARIAYS